jgi:hypothetical protein
MLGDIMVRPSIYNYLDKTGDNSPKEIIQPSSGAI